MMKSPETPGFLHYGVKMNELDKLVTICHANIDRSDKCREYLYKKRKLSLNLINNPVGAVSSAVIDLLKPE